MFLNKNIMFYIILCIKDFINSLPHYNSKYKNIYGKDYGTKWIYLPDGDGVPHYVNLRKPEKPNMLDVRDSSTNNVEFRLYIGNNKDTYIILNESAQPLDAFHKNTIHNLKLSDKPLKMITHGWKSGADKEGVTIIKNAYLESRAVNIITIDWSGIADSIFYHWVANETKAIGIKVATLINELHSRYNVTGNQFHLIGHSLGAHIMGIAASKSNVIVDRITGLDPARPLFEYPIQTDLERLDPSDASFVDIIHTCSGVLGFEAATGTVDFYPNSGIPPQPGCESLQKIFEACSHGRSFQYFSESIKHPAAFPAFQCQSWFEYLENRCSNFGFMGDNVDRNMTGKYYLKTKSYRPFGFYSPLLY